MQVLCQNKIPKLNPGIHIHHREEEYIITFHDNNCHLKINSNIYALIKLIDNNKNLTEIVSEYNSSNDNKIDTDMAHEILFHKLGYYNIIENDGIKHDPYKSPAYLKLNYIFINEYYTQILTRPFLFLFRKKLMAPLIISCLLVFTAALLINFKDTLNYLIEIPPIHYITYIILMILSSIFHEMGHAGATYYYGGVHSGIGFGFYLLTPVLYSDVSSAWKFETKKRIVVNLAGIYFEMVLGTVLILIALLAGSKPLLLIPFIIFLKTLFNLNPFFRTDGYWILSDLIKVPNLRSISEKLLSDFIANRLNETRSRLTNFLILYALISYSFILIFLFSVIILYPGSVITFPKDITIYVTALLTGHVQFHLNQISNFLIPFMFYFLIIRFTVTSIKKYYRSKNISSSENQTSQ